MPELITEQQGEPKQRVTRPREPAFSWTIVAVLGLGLAIVGWTDVGLLWWPLRLGDPEWEFGIVSSTFDAMPLGVLGLGLLAAGLYHRGNRTLVRVLAVIIGLVALDALVSFGIYLFDVPIAFGGVAAELKGALKKAVLKTSVLGTTYIVLLGWMSAVLWKRS